MGKYKDRGRRLLYCVWRQIKKRCLEPDHKQYAEYGGRGIGVSEDWQTNFQSFYEWAKGVGKVPKPINLVFLPISDRP